jgi:hypothetical protein
VSSAFGASFSRIGVEVLPPKKLRMSAGILLSSGDAQFANAMRSTTVSCRKLELGEAKWLLLSKLPPDNVRDLLREREIATGDESREYASSYIGPPYDVFGTCIRLQHTSSEN